MIVVAFLRRDMLTERRPFRIISGVSTALFLTSLVLHFTDIGRHTASGALFVPLLTLGLFHLCRERFIKRYKREPKDTFLDWGGGLAADRLFNVVYFVSASWLWMLVPFIMKQLAEAGW